MNSVGEVIGLPITNHSSPITLRHAPDFSLSKVTLAQGKSLTSHNGRCRSRRPRPVCSHTLSTIQALLFARLLAELIASKGRPHLSQMTNLLPRNRICSTFISTPVNVRLALSPLRSLLFCPISSCWTQTVDYVLPSDYILRSLPDVPYLDLVPGMPKLHRIGQTTFVRFPPISIPPKEWICGTHV